MAGESSSVKSISLSLTSQYAPSWKTWEGVRELVQNWHDGVFSSLEKLQVFSSKVDFLSCKEENLQVYRAVLKADNLFPFEGKGKEDNRVDVLTNETQNCDQTFDAGSDDHKAGNVELGRIVYSPARQKLTLINHDTELMRKVLLLGFSKKASNKEVIGQFGEGLKVGALALVREGRVVSMETSKDRWKFGLSHDEAFDEEVLTVFVDDRWKESDDNDNDDDDNADLEQTDTRVSVFPLHITDWAVYLKRFLFLCPPSDCVKSEVGTLLVGDYCKGQLYVKGVWVSDLSQDGLASGVDLVHLKIDRDRRAVIHLSEIDHQISSMWVHAIEQRPDLIPYYYSLLEQNCTSDVRHANFYLSDKSALLVAQQFFAVHGAMTYPVPNSISAEKLNEIKQEIHQKLVLCNQSLFDALCKSGLVDPLETLLSRATTKKSVIVPYADLTQEEIDILQHVEKLVQLCYPEFSMVSMDISESARHVIHRKELGHYEIPRMLLSGRTTHHCEGVVPDLRRGTRCLCREAWIVSKILALQPEQLVQVDNSSADDCTVKLVASLAMQVCQMNRPFCQDLHREQQSSQQLFAPSVFKEREEMLQREKDLLSEKLLEKDRNHAQELLKLQSKISSLEKDLVSQQVKSANIEQEIAETWKKRFENELHDKMTELSSTITDLKQDKIFYQQKLAEVVEDLDNKQKAHSRQVSVLNDRSDILRKRLADKFEQLTQIVLASKDSEHSSVADVLKSTTKEIEEMWFQKDNCIICTIEKPNCVIIPCRHQITCYKCTSFLLTCSYCRAPIQQKILTYGL